MGLEISGLSLLEGFILTEIMALVTKLPLLSRSVPCLA